MPLTRNAFSVISSLIDKKCSSQRQIAEAAGLSLGLVNETYKSLLELGFVKDYIVTDLGEEALLPYKVNNAIILAAGLSTRFVPISYDRPKGTLRVRGEVLIERQIRQPKEAGADNILMVVGYKKEEYFYLEDRFGQQGNTWGIRMFTFPITTLQIIRLGSMSTTLTTMLYGRVAVG